MYETIMGVQKATGVSWKWSKLKGPMMPKGPRLDGHRDHTIHLFTLFPFALTPMTWKRWEGVGDLWLLRHPYQEIISYFWGQTRILKGWKCCSHGSCVKFALSFAVMCENKIIHGRKSMPCSDYSHRLGNGHINVNYAD